MRVATVRRCTRLLLCQPQLVASASAVPCRSLAHKVVETKDEATNTITIEGSVKPPSENRLLASADSGDSCADDGAPACILCHIGTPVKYHDVLILRQFMRDDGSVLPREATGICEMQQTLVEQCVMQAHWSGLFKKNRPTVAGQDAELKGYKQYSRYWNSGDELWERELRVIRGSWYYKKQYERIDRFDKKFLDKM